MIPPEIAKPLVRETIILRKNENGWRSVHLELLLSQPWLVMLEPENEIFDMDMNYCYASRIPALMDISDENGNIVNYEDFQELMMYYGLSDLNDI